jgi:hypothetical protein
LTSLSRGLYRGQSRTLTRLSFFSPWACNILTTSRWLRRYRGIIGDQRFPDIAWYVYADKPYADRRRTLVRQRLIELQSEGLRVREVRLPGDSSAAILAQFVPTRASSRGFGFPRCA